MTDAIQEAKDLINTLRNSPSFPIIISSPCEVEFLGLHADEEPKRLKAHQTKLSSYQIVGVLSSLLRRIEIDNHRFRQDSEWQQRNLFGYLVEKRTLDELRELIKEGKIKDGTEIRINFGGDYHFGHIKGDTFRFEEEGCGVLICLMDDYVDTSSKYFRGWWYK